MTFACCCLNQKKKISTNIGKYEPSDETLIHVNLNCDSSELYFKKICFIINHEVLSLKTLENYRVRIGWRGHIYFGRYESQGINVELPFCNDDEKHILTFYLFDKSDRNIYIWSLKENFSLAKIDTISVVLKSDGDFKITDLK